MNPSKELWITKFFKQCNPSFFSELSDELFYDQIRKTGFIYGYTTKTIQPEFNLLDLTTEEKTKVVLLEALYGTYILTTNNSEIKTFTNHIQEFYSKINQAKTDAFFGLIKFESKSKFASLEKIINQRITISSSLIDKTITPYIANFLLFTDILVFKRYLINKKEILPYYQYLERTIATLIQISFNKKQNKSKYDIKIKNVIEQSLKFTSLNNETLPHNLLDFGNIKTYYGKAYLYDLSLIVLWNDAKIDIQEKIFLIRLSNQLKYSKYDSENAFNAIQNFIEKYKDNIPYFQLSNPLKQLYNYTNKNIILLVKRNKKALVKELENNKILMQLVLKSTHTSLTKKEKQQLKIQLIELGKTIPAFTIFLLPGGSLLLPILIKLLPQILPNSFNENK